MQTSAGYYNPGLSGQMRVPLEGIEPLPLDERKIVARRAAQELTPGAVINVGVGMPDGIASVAAEEGWFDQLNVTVEQGQIGGLPARGVIFGAAYNPIAMVEEDAQFNFYDGGGIDVAFLGMAQADRHGNVNASKVGGMLAGCGGFINISQNAKKVVFCGTFTAKGFACVVGGGRLQIEREGSIHKFIDHVDQITFSGDYARSVAQPVLYVTERAVFQLAPDSLVLTEIAPGIDLERDVLAQMGFRPDIAEDLKMMDEAIFQ
jgi:propionate CoA-transferase